MGLVQIFVVASAAAAAGALVMASVSAMRSQRSRRHGRRLAIALCYLAGMFFGGLLAWKVVPPPEWKLSFWTTIQASVDAQSYTHLVEHTAENILVAVLVSGVIGGILFAGADAIAARLVLRLKRA
jgi:hypothetical protein